MWRVLLILALFLTVGTPARAALVTDGGPPPSLVIVPERPPLPDGADVRSALTRARLTEAIAGRRRPALARRTRCRRARPSAACAARGRPSWRRCSERWTRSPRPAA